jgi:hypothetical protein
MATVDGKAGFFAVKYNINIDFKKIFFRLVSFFFPKQFWFLYYNSLIENLKFPTNDGYMTKSEWNGLIGYF